MTPSVAGPFARDFVNEDARESRQEIADRSHPDRGTRQGAYKVRRYISRRTSEKPDIEPREESLRSRVLQQGRAIGRMRSSSSRGSALLPLATDDARPDAVGPFYVHP